MIRNRHTNPLDILVMDEDSNIDVVNKERGNMSFAILAPLTIALGLFIALPIYAHLVRREPKEQLYFGAMMLLRRLEKTKKRRSRIHDLLLLLLRIVALIAFILSLSQMELQWPNVDTTTEVSKRVVIIIDNSMSMNHIFSDDETSFNGS